MSSLVNYLLWVPSSATYGTRLRRIFRKGPLGDGEAEVLGIVNFTPKTDPRWLAQIDTYRDGLSQERVSALLYHRARRAPVEGNDPFLRLSAWQTAVRRDLIALLQRYESVDHGFWFANVLSESVGLTLVSAGSSRAVLDLGDGRRVLKAAMTHSGMVANRREAIAAARCPEDVAQVYEADPYGYWLIAEMVAPLIADTRTLGNIEDLEPEERTAAESLVERLESAAPLPGYIMDSHPANFGWRANGHLVAVDAESIIPPEMVLLPGETYLERF